MKSKIFVLLLFFSYYLYSQNPTTISVTITNDGNEVARIGRTYTYTYSNWNENCYAWGFDKTNTNLACINGNDQPPWNNCANYFTSSSSIESNVVYLNTSTTVRYVKTDGSFTNGSVNARIKFTATKTDNSPINFNQNGNIIYILANSNFKIKVEIQLQGPTDAMWFTSYSGQWASALDIYDNLHTDDAYRIFTSYDPTYTGFYTLPSNTTAPTITSPTCGSSTTNSNVTFQWTNVCTSHPNSHYEYSFNGGAWTNNGTTNSKIVTLNVGQNSFQVRYYDGCKAQYYTSDICYIYYAPDNYCGDINHGGNDWTISSNTTVSGNHINVGTFTINSGVTVTVNPTCHYFYVSANDIVMNGTIDADGAGETGGNGGAYGTLWDWKYGTGQGILNCKDKDDCYQLKQLGGTGGGAGNGTGGGNAGSNGGEGTGFKQICKYWNDGGGELDGSGGGGGGAGGSYGGKGGSGGAGGSGGEEHGSRIGDNDCKDMGSIIGSGGNGGLPSNIYGDTISENIQWGSGGGGAGGGGRGAACYPSYNGTWQIYLYDSYGDGWDGGNVTVNINGVNVLTQVTVSSGSLATYYFNVSVGQVVTITYTAGQWPEENSYYIYTNTGELYYSSSQPPSASYQFTVPDRPAGRTCYSNGENGGTGGGAVKLIASNNLTLSGTINANGTNGGNGGDGGENVYTSKCCNDWDSGDDERTYSGAGGGGGGAGGGAGGGVMIKVEGTLTFTGTINAKGGNGGNGGKGGYSSRGYHGYKGSGGAGGGGGRIKIFVNPCANNTLSGTCSITGGSGGSPGSSGAGTGSYGNSGSDGTYNVINLSMPYPTVTASASPSSICSGGSSVITASGASTYTWSHSLGSGTSKTVTPSSTTTYSVTGTNNYGCTGSTTVTVTVNPLPTVAATASPAAICNGATSVLTASGANTYSWSGGLGSGASKTVTPSATTTYTVTGTSTAGCTGTATVSVTVNPLPTVAATASPSTICVGGTSVLTASGANTYSWSHSLGTGSSKTVSPTSTTTYTVTGTTTAGCTGTATVSVTVNPLPSVSASASPAAICNGATSVLTASSNITGTTYSWNTGGNTASITVTPSATTTYTVTGTTGAGCSGTATVSVTVNPLPSVTASASPAAICNGATSVLTASSNITGTTYSWNTGGNTASITVTPSATTTYTVTGTTGAGCKGTATVSVSVLPPINYGSVASGDETICYSGDPANITMAVLPSGSGSFTYQWYYQDGIVSCPSGTSTSGWTAISGANSSSYNPPSGLTGSRTYAVFITPSGTPTCGTSQWASGCRQVTVTGQMIWTGNAGDGNWHNAANWCGIVPTPTLDAIIPNGCSTYPNNYSSTTATCKTLTIESDASVSIADNITLDCEEDVINNGTLTMIGNSTLKCGRNWNNINGTFNAGNGTVVFDSNDGTINTGGNGANKKFYNVECNAAGKTKTQNGAIDCDNNFTITAGTWSTGGYSMNIAGNWTNNGTFTHGNNTVIFDGSANQTIKAGASPFYEVIINNSGNPITYNVSILSNMDIADTLKIKKGLFLINGGYSLNMTNSSIPSSTNVYIIDIYSGGILKLDNSSSQITRQDVDADIRVQQGGELNINAGTLIGFDYHQIEGKFNMTGGSLTTHDAGDKGRIKFTGTASGSQTAGIIEFNSLLQAMSGTSWYASGGLIRTIGSSNASINVSEHNFYINNLEIYGNTNKNVQQTSNVTSGSIPDLDIRGYLKIYSSITLNSNNKDITIAGDWTNDGTYSYGSNGNVVIFNGNIDQNISGSNSTTFYNLIIDKTNTKLILNVNNTTVKNNLTLTNGAIDLNQKTLIVDNPSSAAISRTNGYILSDNLDQDFNSKVQWNIGTIATGEYIYPFGKNALTYIPFRLNVTTAGVGNVSVSTYPTSGTDANGVYSNKPNIVTNLNSPLYPDPPAPGNAINIVRRFWYINKSGGSGIADLTFSWAASEDPLSGAINTMIAQRYLEQINKWEYPPLDAQSSSILNTPRYVTVPNVINFSPWAITRNDHPLPISLLYFNGDCKDSIVVLNWATASEINNDYFTIEYTNNLNDEPVVWTPICTIDGAGNSNTIKTYQYIDKPYKRDNSSNVIFYRLKQTDFNGSFTYSNTIDIHCLNAQDNDIEIINAYCEQQNSCNIVNVLFRMPGDKDYTIKLYNIYGQLIAKTSGISKDGYNQTQIYLNDILDQAIYVVILLNNENIKTKKVLLY